MFIPLNFIVEEKETVEQAVERLTGIFLYYTNVQVKQLSCDQLREKIKANEHLVLYYGVGLQILKNYVLEGFSSALMLYRTSFVDKDLQFFWMDFESEECRGKYGLPTE